MERHGLSGQTLVISDEALLTVIHRYTREPGVWQLSRALATLCRKLARETAFGRPWPERLDSMEVMRHLGRPPVQALSAEPKDEVGVAMGLAWTSEGGDILPIEAVRLPGAGDVQLTGQLGDVMRESAAAALSFVRSRAEALEVPITAFAETAMHIHLPEGAIPKDGPSAGLALAVVIASLMTNRPVRHDVAMTGEITLRGRILPVGGVREKVLGAPRRHPHRHPAGHERRRTGGRAAGHPRSDVVHHRFHGRRGAGRGPGLARGARTGARARDPAGQGRARGQAREDAQEGHRGQGERRKGEGQG
jgi:ATP-dependent Lon protease